MTIFDTRPHGELNGFGHGNFPPSPKESAASLDFRDRNIARTEPDVGGGLMTPAQESMLRKLCGRYRVEFRPEHYLLYPDILYPKTPCTSRSGHDRGTLADGSEFTAAAKASDVTRGWVEGWLGGRRGLMFFGVSPEGQAYSRSWSEAW